MFEGASGHQNALFLLPTGGDLGLSVSLRGPTDPVFIENTRFHAADRRRDPGREKFYAGASFIVRNHSFRETPWDDFHRVVDELMESYDVPTEAELNARLSDLGKA